MRKFFLLALLILSARLVNAQATTALFVGGDNDKFYPVVFQDNNWNNQVATELELGRSSVHSDAIWKGSVIAKFRFHTTRWGNGSNFIDADIRQNKNQSDGSSLPFIGGYRDATTGNASFNFIVWLRGSTTYYYRSNATQVPEVYDGVKNPLPFMEENNSPLTYKTTMDSYVNIKGSSYDGVIYTHGSGLNYMYGDLALGTLNTKGYKLSVNGKIRAQEILVEAGSANWPDYVFAKDYKLTPLSEVESYIKANQHLPEMPAAAQVEKEGVSLGDMNKKLLQKIEELTLHLIEQEKQLKTQQGTIQELSKKVLKLSNTIPVIKR